MKPTPEQVAAAKAWVTTSTGSPMSAEHVWALGAYAKENEGRPNLHRWHDSPPYILLAALEAAEQDSARLSTAIDEAIDNASGRWCEWGERAEESFRILRAARKAQP